MEKISTITSGRINLIGEHIDYINGLAITATINLHTKIEIIKINKNWDKKYKIDENIRKFEPKIVVYSSNFNQLVMITPFNYKIKLLNLQKEKINLIIKKINNNLNGMVENNFGNSDNSNNIEWVRYIIGVLKFFEDSGVGINFEHLVNISGDLPLSAGLSSSASLLIGLISTYGKLLNIKFSNKNIIDYAKEIENRYLGSPCGYLDQYAIMFGKKNSFTYLDFKDHKVEYLKLNFNSREYQFLFYIINSNIKHSISGGEYGKRVYQKDQIEGIIQKSKNMFIREYIDNLIEKYDLINRLKLIEKDFLSGYDKEYENKKKLKFRNKIEEKIQVLKNIIEKENFIKDEVLKMRFLHYFSEILRVYLFKSYIKKLDYYKAFNLLNESHYSLSKLYEVSIKQIEFIIFNLKKNDDIFLGSRLIGGGFGGSILTIIEKRKIKEANNILEMIKEKYKKVFNLEMKYYMVQLEDGVK